MFCLYSLARQAVFDALRLVTQGADLRGLEVFRVRFPKFWRVELPHVHKDKTLAYLVVCGGGRRCGTRWIPSWSSSPQYGTFSKL